jgi:multidrug efflux pump subunit AcrA (membrane-fusion protein)
MYLADVSLKKVVARVDESDYGRVLNISPLLALPETPGLRQAIAETSADIEERTGQVRLTVDAFPEETFQGRISRVEPQGKLNQGSAIIQYDVHVAIDDLEVAKLPLGAQAQVEFTVESAEDVLRIPAEAVKSYQGERGVWVVVPPPEGSTEEWGKRFVPCRFGITDGEYTQVIEVQGDYEMDDGTKVYTKLPVDREELED